MSEQPQPKKNRRWVGVAQMLISVLLLIWLFSRAGLDEILAALAGINPFYYMLAGIVLLASLGVRALRWYVLLIPLGAKRVSPLKLFWLYLIGFFWNGFLPSGFGGDVVKAIELNRIIRDPAASTISVIAERAEGLLATSLIGLVAIAIRPDLVPSQAAWLVIGLSIAIVLGVWVLRQNVLEWIGKRFPFLAPLVSHKKIVGVHDALRAYSLRHLGLGLLAAIPFTVLSIIDNWLVGVALGIDLGIGYYAIFTPLITIINLLPLSFNGVGVREWIYPLLFGLVGVSAQQAIAMALAFNLLRFGVGLIGGIVSLVSGLQHVRSAPVNAEGQ